MNFYKSSALLAASTAAKMLLALYTVKVTAVTLGLAGTGVIGQFNNLLLIATMLAGGGIASGIVKIAARQDKPLSEIRRGLDSAYGYGLTFTTLVVTIIVLGGQWFAPLLPVEHGVVIIVLLAVSQYGLFQIAVMTALLNSRGYQNLVAISSLASGAVGAVLITLGCIYFGLVGTLVGIIAGTLSQGIFLYALARHNLPELALLGRPRLVSEDLRFWAYFSLLSFISVIGMPFALLVARGELAAMTGWEAAGVWQAMIRLSDAYLQFGLLFLSSFYFPRLAALSSIAESKQVLVNYIRVIFPCLLLLFVVIYWLRTDIVLLLFSSEFDGVTALFFPQLIGDLFRVLYYMISYIFLANGNVKLFMMGELAQASIFWLIATQIGLTKGAVGMAWSYAGTYIALFGLILIVYFFLVRVEVGESRIRD